MSPIKKPALRGTIIVDASTLIRLSHTVFAEHKNNGKMLEQPLKHHIEDTYLNVLPFLAAHGYRIVIPEMVCSEAALALAADNFAHSIKDYNPHKTRYVSPPLTKFLKEVKARHYPGMIIAMHTGPEEVNRYLDEMHKIIKSNMNVQIKRRMLSRYQKSDKDDLGEEAIKECVAKLLDMGSDKKTIFILSDDKRALYDTWEQYDTRSLNTNGLFKALVENGVHELLGLDERVAYREIWSNLHNHGRAYDTSGWHPDHKPVKSMQPFSQSLHGLAHSFDVDEPNHRWRHAIRDVRGRRHQEQLVPGP